MEELPFCERFKVWTDKPFFSNSIIPIASSVFIFCDFYRKKNIANIYSVFKSCVPSDPTDFVSLDLYPW